MATEKQIEANRKNAKKSTGPTSLWGKQLSSKNATKHGLTARHTVLIPGETAEAYDKLLADCKEHYAPADAWENRLVERIAVTQWRLERCGRIESGLLRWGMHDAYLLTIGQRNPMNWPLVEHRMWWSGGQEDHRSEKELDLEMHNIGTDGGVSHVKMDAIEGPMGFAVKGFHQSGDELKLLMRYEASLQRLLQTATRELERLQDRRLARERREHRETIPPRAKEPRRGGKSPKRRLKPKSAGRGRKIKPTHGEHPSPPSSPLGGRSQAKTPDGARGRRAKPPVSS